MSYESPDYDVLAKHDGYEIRHYEPYLVAETEVDGTFEASGNRAFRLLAGYIFGNNRESKKMAMTVPVTRQPAAAGKFAYRFVMERAYDESTLPQPNDDSVAIRRLPGGHFAVRRYRGSTGEKRYRREERALLAALESSGIAVIGPSISGRLQRSDDSSAAAPQRGDGFRRVAGGYLIGATDPRASISFPIGWPNWNVDLDSAAVCEDELHSPSQALARHLAHEDLPAVDRQ